MSRFILPIESNWNESPSFRHLTKEHINLTVILSLNNRAYCSRVDKSLPVSPLLDCQQPKFRGHFCGFHFLA